MKFSKVNPKVNNDILKERLVPFLFTKQNSLTRRILDDRNELELRRLLLFSSIEKDLAPCQYSD